MSESGSSGHDERTLISTHDREFEQLHLRFCSLITLTPDGELYRQPANLEGASLPSVAEGVLRGARAVEQTFGGITANLWDDPFEWTLPENLATAARVIEYLEEVEATRQRAFLSFAGDGDLRKEIMLPSGEPATLESLLTTTLAKALKYLERAEAAQILLADSSFARPAG